MSIEQSYGFRSAQAAWENANPYDNDCTCIEAEWFICNECGEEDPDALWVRDCRECDGEVRLMTDDETIDLHPKLNCPRHKDQEEYDQ